MKDNSGERKALACAKIHKILNDERKNSLNNKNC